MRFLFCAVVVLLAGSISFAEQKDPEFDLVDQAFHKPSDDDLERLRDIFNNLDLDQKVLDRFAYRCEAFYANNDRPEHFVSVHAVDRKLDAVRHVIRRTFTDNADPRLGFSIESSEGYGDTRVTGPSVFPTRHDKLRLKGKIHFSVEQEVPADKVKFTGQDRNFNPVTCSLLPLSSFFNGGISKRDLSGVFDIGKLKPEQVSIVGSRFITRSRITDQKGNPMAFVAFMCFSDGVPVRYEIWRVLADRRELHFRTTTTWAKTKGTDFPVEIEAIQVRGAKIDTLNATLSWKFNDDVPDRLFDVNDLNSKDALRW